MPRYYEGKEEDRRPCSGLREDLKECLLRSSCVLKMGPTRDLAQNVVLGKEAVCCIPKENMKERGLRDGKTPKQCAREGHCKDFVTSFFECKRSLLDNTRRFKGRKGY